MASSAMPAHAQAAAPPPASPPPAIRRWVDVQHLQLAGRYRWIETSAGRVSSSTLQWQSQVRGRFLFDPAARYSINVGAFTGNAFAAGWDNTGVGLGFHSEAFGVKQLFVAAEPVRGIEVQAGGLYVNRGESTEILSYDNDGYIMGERLTLRPSKGRVTQVSVTTGYLGDVRTPTVFRRFRHMNDWNYRQLLVGARVAPRMDVSADYTHDRGTDTLREGMTLRLPAASRIVTSVKAELYQRVSRDHGYGFNLATDLRLHRRLVVTAGGASVDPRYGPLNADRFETGHRLYDTGTFTLTRDVTLGWFHDEAIATPYPLANRHRFEVIATINPTASLKRVRIF